MIFSHLKVDETNEEENSHLSGTCMDSTTVITLLKLFEANGIEVIVDGGWGVDALLGKQTRQHNDLDIATSHHNVAKLRALLNAHGYKEIPRDDTSEYNFVMRDTRGHEIDIHTYLFDDKGNNTGGIAYPADSLTGAGTINGYSVRCISPEWMVKFHTGYELDENDYHDVRALCEHFNLTMPDEFKKFEDNQ